MFTSVQLSRAILKSYFTVCRRSFDIKGIEYLPVGPKIIAMNHTPGCDPLYLPFVLSDTPHFLLQNATFTIPVIGWLLKQTGQIPVQRGTEKAREAVVQACSILRDGGTIAIFPEGRDVEYGTRIPAKTGAVRMALETGAPIIPVGLFVPPHSLTPLRFHWQGSERTGAWQFSGKSYMRFGSAWHPNPCSDIHSETEELMNRIYLLVSEAERDSRCAFGPLLNLEGGLAR
ncbi:MAG TPA: lysophospholipid acyltransferase family protein [Anaerolineales bacterium]|nr:lysophospholipid acyltransferase family protein [Anaerolineales bacterium]